MIYYPLRFYTRFALKLFFRKIYFSNVNGIPKDKPVLLAANHPSSFVDATLLACFLPRELHFIVRGDVFLKRYLWFFKGTNQIPMFRRHDGLANVQKNFETFKYCYQALAEKKTILIFSEGFCVQEKRLRPIQKGTSKMAYGAEENYDFNLDVHIVPVGINYTYPSKLRSEVMLEVGEPIRILDYKEYYDENPNKAHRKITQAIQQKLGAQVIIIDKEEDEDLFEDLLQLLRVNVINDDALPFVTNENEILHKEKALGVTLNSMPEVEKESLKKQVERYKEQMKRLPFPLTVRTIQDRKEKDASFINLFLLIIGFPLFLVGYILYIFPLTFMKSIGERRAKQVKFYASIMLGAGMLINLVYMLVLGIIIGGLTKWWIGFTSLFILPHIGWFSVLYSEFYKKYQQSNQYLKVKKKHSQLIENIQQQIEMIELEQLVEQK